MLLDGPIGKEGTENEGEDDDEDASARVLARGCRCPFG